jgi:hypothetical protein
MLRIRKLPAPAPIFVYVINKQRSAIFYGKTIFIQENGTDHCIVFAAAAVGSMGLVWRAVEKD